MPYITSDVSMKVRSLILDVFVNHTMTTNHNFIPVGSKVWPRLRSTGICFPMADFCLIWFLDHIMKMLYSISMEAVAAGKPLVDFRGVSIDWGYKCQKEKCLNSTQPTWELSESWFGSLLGGTFSEFSAAPSLPSQLILNFVTLTQGGV